MGWENLARAESTTRTVTGPRIFAPVPLGVRATLLERGVWTEVRSVLEARDLESALLLEGLARTEWLPLSAHVALVTAITQVLGQDGARRFAALRTQESIMGGLFPNLLRSWVRSFRDNPASLLRIGPQIWQMAFREAGEFVIDEVRPSGASVRIIDCEAMATSVAWRRMIEGSSVGILRLAGLRANVAYTVQDATTTRGETEWIPLAA